LERSPSWRRLDPHQGVTSRMGLQHCLYVSSTSSLVTSTSLLDHKPSAVTNELHRCVCHLPTLSKPTGHQRPGSVMKLFELIYLVKCYRSMCVHTTKHEAQKLCHKIFPRPAASLPITSRSELLDTGCAKPVNAAMASQHICPFQIRIAVCSAKSHTIPSPP
jgi:hypothetical protein